MRVAKRVVLQIGLVVLAQAGAGGCGPEPLTSVTESPALAKGSKPGNGVAVTLEYLPDYLQGAGAFDVNDAGVVVGYVNDASGNSQAARWEKTKGEWTLTVLGPGAAHSVNSAGDILLVTANTDGTGRAWVQRAGIEGPIDLGLVQHAALPGQPVGLVRLADNGRVLARFGAGSTSRPATWEPGTSGGALRYVLPPQGLGEPASANPHSISPDGKFVAGSVGTGSTPTTKYFAAVWRATSSGWEGALLNANQTEEVAEVYAINNLEVKAGFVRQGCQGDGQSGCPLVAVAWNADGTTDELPGCLYEQFKYGYVRDMNNSSQVVGECQVPILKGKNVVGRKSQLFWSSPTAAPVTLSTSGMVWAVNNARLAVGRYGDMTGSSNCGLGAALDGCRAVVWRLP